MVTLYVATGSVVSSQEGKASITIAMCYSGTLKQRTFLGTLICPVLRCCSVFVNEKFWGISMICLCIVEGPLVHSCVCVKIHRAVLECCLVLNVVDRYYCNY